MELRWRRAKLADHQACEAFLRVRALRCMNACIRFFALNAEKRHREAVWILGERGTIQALLIYAHDFLFPVFDLESGFSPSPLPETSLRGLHIKGIQGCPEDVCYLNTLFQAWGRMPSETIDYILMSLNRAPNAAVYLAGPQALELRHGRPQDIETLFPLQAAYEKEEVLPFGMDLTLSSCHYHLMEMLKNQTVMSAWLGGEPVGKINTSGSAFNYTQIGGVYVAPGYRRMGIAGRLTTALSSELITSGKTVTLFVKKNNKTACGIYLRSGFEHCGNYRICYYD